MAKKKIVRRTVRKPKGVSRVVQKKKSSSDSKTTNILLIGGILAVMYFAFKMAPAKTEPDDDDPVVIPDADPDPSEANLPGEVFVPYDDRGNGHHFGEGGGAWGEVERSDTIEISDTRVRYSVYAGSSFSAPLHAALFTGVPTGSAPAYWPGTTSVHKTRDCEYNHRVTLTVPLEAAPLSRIRLYVAGTVGAKADDIIYPGPIPAPEDPGYKEVLLRTVEYDAWRMAEQSVRCFVTKPFIAFIAFKTGFVAPSARLRTFIADSTGDPYYVLNDYQYSAGMLWTQRIVVNAVKPEHPYEFTKVGLHLQSDRGNIVFKFAINWYDVNGTG